MLAPLGGHRDVSGEDSFVVGCCFSCKVPKTTFWEVFSGLP